jgi:streptomycin 6-kinase
VFNVPTVVSNKAVAAGVREWLDELPSIVDELCHRWGLSLESTYSDATEALVCAVTDVDGDPAVLKVLIPRNDGAFRHELTVLVLAEGVGCVGLLAFDVNHCALLMERLGPTLNSLGLALPERHEIMCACAQRLWRRAPGCGLPSGGDKARWLATFIRETWERLDRPCSERAVAQALACADSRAHAHDDERAVVVHGDLHQWNTLVAADGFKLVDPDGLYAEPEYDLGILMREDPLELLEGDPYERARWLAQRCQLDAEAIWEWGVVERVSTGLLATEVALQPLGRDMLAAADVIARGSARS